MPKIDQMELLFSILNHLSTRYGIKKLIPRHYNAIVRACNSLIAELEKEEIHAATGCGLDVWSASDDTGSSSRFMARTLAPKIGAATVYQDYAYPSDPSDLLRCIGLLKAVPELREHISVMSGTGPEWARLVTHWDQLEKLVESEIADGQAPKTYELMRKILETK